MVNELQECHGEIQCTNRVVHVIKKNVDNTLIKTTKRGKNYTNVFSLRKQPTFLQSLRTSKTRQEKTSKLSSAIFRT